MIIVQAPRTSFFPTLNVGAVTVLEGFSAVIEIEG
jgi:hypothetical protein